MNITRRTKVILLLLSIILFISSFTACSIGGNKTSKQLTVYVNEYDLSTRNAVKEFNEKQKNCKIVEKVFSSDKELEMASEAAAQFLSGTGPDLIVCKSYMFPNLSKYMEKEVFYDLSSQLKKDKDFEKSDYNQAVLNSGIYKGKQYVLPLDYCINTLNTTDEILKKAGTELSKPYPKLSEFANAAINYKDKNEQSKSYFMSYFRIDPLLSGSDTKFIDLENKKCSINNEEFKSLLESYKKLNSSVYPEEELIKLTTMQDISKLLSGEKVVMLNSLILGIEYASEPFSTVKESAGARIITVPSSDGSSHVAAVPERIVAVNSKCKNAEAAYDFIKLMLSEDSQTKDVKFAIPVNAKAFDSQVKEYVNSLKTGQQNDKIKKEVMSQVSDIVKKVDRCSIIDIELLKLIREEVSKYSEDSLPVDQTVKELDQQIQSYFSSEQQEPKVAADSNVNTSPNGPKISIYYMDYDMAVKNAIKLFKDKYKQIQLDERCFPSDSIQQYITTISTEIMSGSGPDVILFNNYTFNSIRKAINSGAFLPLNQLMDNDSDFDKEEYFSSILDAGKINGQYLFIPRNCNINILATTKKTLDKYEISPDKMNWSWESYIELVNRKKISNVIAPSLRLSQFLNSSWSDYIDYDKKVSNFNTEKFKKVLEKYKNLWKVSTPDKTYYKYSDGPSVISANEAVMINEPFFGSPYEIWTENSKYKSVLGEEMILLPIPSLEGKKVIPYTTINACVAINSNCKNNDVAFNFIKMLISKEMQIGIGPDGNSTGSIGVPINKEAYMNDIKFYSSSNGKDKDMSSGNGSTSNRYTTFPISATVLKQYEDMIAKMEVPVFWDYQIYKMLNEEVSEYVNGKKSVDQTAKAINDKVNLMLNE